MNRLWIKLISWSLLAGGLLYFGWSSPMRVSVRAQQPTGSVPTVTGTPLGLIVVVDRSLDQVRVYAGPSTNTYPPIGVMLGGATAPALGRSQDDQWIQIYYAGVPGSVAWVYAPYVSFSGAGGNLPVIAPPATPTAMSTPTIDPTLAAAFIAPETPTRLPTFTPVSPIAVPVFTDVASSGAGRLPMGLIIFSLGFIGVFGALTLFLRGR
jgi:uncharacterized protein YraI